MNDKHFLEKNNQCASHCLGNSPHEIKYISIGYFLLQSFITILHMVIKMRTTMIHIRPSFNKLIYSDTSAHVINIVQKKKNKK